MQNILKLLTMICIVGWAFIVPNSALAQDNIVRAEDFTYGENLGESGDRKAFNVGFSVTSVLPEKDITQIEVRLVDENGNIVATNKATGKGLANLVAYEGQQYSTQFYLQGTPTKELVWANSKYCGQKPAMAVILVTDNKGTVHTTENTNAPTSNFEILENCTPGEGEFSMPNTATAYIMELVVGICAAGVFFLGRKKA
jgi:hypothetical protein